MTTCARCGSIVRQSTGAINRALRQGAPIYCGRECAGLARRTEKSAEEKKAAKRAYDERRRIEKAEQIRLRKAAYFQRTYDPVKAAVVRKARMPKHVAYCRRPEYRAYKSSYDLSRRARMQFGEFAEAALLLRSVENEIACRATRQEIMQTNGTYNKAQMRRRALI